MKAEAAIVRCASYDPQEADAAVGRLMGLLGGMEAFIKPGSRVLVKPNLLMAIEPEAAITTHPAVVRAVVRLLKGIRCTVLIGDGPSVWGAHAENLTAVWDKTGIAEVAREEGVELVAFERRRWRGAFPLAAILDEVDCLVSLPKFKTHELMILTGCVKNLFGLIPDTFKTELHKRHADADAFARTLVDIYREAPPALTIVDAVTSLEGDGPGTGGRLRQTGFLLGGRECVALDSILCAVMGIAPEEVPVMRQARLCRTGVPDISAIEVRGISVREVMGKPFILPKTSLNQKIPRPLRDTAASFIRVLPKIDQAKCTRCGACQTACPVKVITVSETRTTIRYAGCISCFCCQEICPYAAIQVKKSLLARMVGL